MSGRGTRAELVAGTASIAVAGGVRFAALPDMADPSRVGPVPRDFLMRETARSARSWLFRARRAACAAPVRCGVQPSASERAGRRRTSGRDVVRRPFRPLPLSYGTDRAPRLTTPCGDAQTRLSLSRHRQDWSGERLSRLPGRRGSYKVANASVRRRSPLLGCKGKEE